MKAVLLQFALNVCPVFFASADILSGPVVNPANGHDYYLLTAQNWDAAEAEAVTLGGHLATVRNAEEQAWIFSAFSNFGFVNRTLMIGLNDATIEGSFAWASGETTGYRNWEFGEPNNFQPTYNQDYAVMRAPGTTAPGFWRDVALTESGTYNGVVEAIPAAETLTPTVTTAVELGWPTETTKQYQLQSTSELGSSAVWENVGAQFTGTGQTFNFLASARGNEQKFYRVLIITPQP